MDTYRTMLFLHIVSLAIGLSAGTVLVLSLFHLRDSTTLAEAAPWGALAGHTEKAFPVAILGLFATGAYMTSDAWSWTTSWILVSFIGLALLTVGAIVVGTQASKMLKRALEENGPGALGDTARRMTRHPLLWVTEFGNLGVVFGIIWNMTQKPGTAEAVAAIIVGYAIAAGLALRFTRKSTSVVPAVAGTAS